MSLISKKDLLAITGISYGQLYRWKRQRLIPEEWFVKKSSYTGQETFLPREQIVSRIETILQLKDQYSMEELAAMFAGKGHSDTGLPAEFLQGIEELPLEWRSNLPGLLHRQKITWSEIVMAVYLAGQETFSMEEKEMLLGQLPNPIPEGNNMVVAAFKAGEEAHVVFGSESLIFDAGIEAKVQSVSELTDQLRKKYR